MFRKFFNDLFTALTELTSVKAVIAEKIVPEIAEAPETSPLLSTIKIVTIGDKTNGLQRALQAAVDGDVTRGRLTFDEHSSYYTNDRNLMACLTIQVPNCPGFGSSGECYKTGNYMPTVIHLPSDEPSPLDESIIPRKVKQD